MKVTAIVPAAGDGKRCKNRKGVRKPFFNLKGRPILACTLEALAGSAEVDEIIVVVHPEDIGRAWGVIKKYRLGKIKAVVAGGSTRAASVRNALAAAPEDAHIILIHDGARPFVSKAMIRDSVKSCVRHGASVCAVPAVSTIKTVNKGLTVTGTPDRRAIYEAQTPQAFKKDVIYKAYRNFRTRKATDDSMLVERAGHTVKIVPGSYRNIKITTPEDLALAEILLDKKTI